MSLPLLTPGPQCWKDSYVTVHTVVKGRTIYSSAKELVRVFQDYGLFSKTSLIEDLKTFEVFFVFVCSLLITNIVK